MREWRRQEGEGTWGQAVGTGAQCDSQGGERTSPGVLWARGLDRGQWSHGWVPGDLLERVMEATAGPATPRAQEGRRQTLRPAGACPRGTLGSSHSTVCLGMSSAGRARAPLCPNLASPLCDLQTAASASSTGASPSCRGRHKSPETMLTGSQGAPRGPQCEVSSQGPLRAQESPERGWLLSP